MSAWKILRAWLVRPGSMIVPLLVLSACGGDSPTAPRLTLEHDPIVFVHGYGGTPSDWNLMISRFKAAGWTDAEVVTVSYGVLQSNATTAADIRKAVDSVLARITGTKVDLVTFSMGSLSGRYYLKNLGGADKVDAFVSLAGPNHGTDAGFACSFTPCLEVQTGSAFLATLNAGDETPGAPRYATWRSPCDATVNVPASVILSGAVNKLTGCIGHTQMLSDQTVFDEVKIWVPTPIQ